MKNVTYKSYDMMNINEYQFVHIWKDEFLKIWEKLFCEHFILRYFDLFNSINFLSLVKYFLSVTCRTVERDYLPGYCQVQLPTLYSRVMTSYSLTLSLCSYCFLITGTSLQFMSAVNV